MATKKIDVAGCLNAATADGIIAESGQIKYGDTTVEETLSALESGAASGLSTEEIDAAID